MRHQPRSAKIACLGLAALLLCPTPAATQAPPRRGLVPSLGLTGTTATGATGATAGVRAGLLTLRPGGIGFDFGLAWLVPSRTHAVFRRYGAVSTDIGLAYLRPGVAADLVVGVGGSFLLNGNGSAEIAPIVRLGALRALSDRVGIRADLVGRYWFHGPGLGAGLDAGLLWLPGPPSAPSTSPPGENAFDGWTFGAAANLLAVRHDLWDLSFRGPAVTAARVNPRGVGFESALTWIVPTGRYGFTGASLDLGLAWALPAGPSSLILFRVGATALVGGDSDGSGGGQGAVYPGIGVLQRIAGPLAVRADFTPRVWLGEAPATTFGWGVGLVLAR